MIISPRAEPFADVWHVDTEDVRAQDSVERWFTILTDDERRRHDRILPAHVKLEFLLTRALVRTTLSRYAPRVHPADWRFVAGPWGKPELDPHAPSPPSPLHFNVSNTRGRLAMVVTSAAAAGIDVEATDRPGETVSLADRFFASAEILALRALPVAAQRERFFELWTLKEAYMKARGMGLALPLDGFAFHLRGEGLRQSPDITIEFAESVQDTPAAWYFRQFRPSRRHLAALAISTEGPPPRVVERDALPFPAL